MKTSMNTSMKAYMQKHSNNPAHNFGQILPPPPPNQSKHSSLLVRGLSLILLGLTLTACGGGGGGGASAAAPNNDIDGDGIVNSADNCLYVANPGQSDLDGGGVGDVCDTINDNDTDGTKDAYDVDADGDGLIEIHTVLALNAMRYNLEGTGLDLADDGDQTGGNATGCGGSGGLTACTGYELMTNIDLNDLPTDASGSNWQPIGSCTNDVGIVNCENLDDAMTADFNGNHHTISNVMINITQSVFGVGFFGVVGVNVTIKNVHLRDVFITTDLGNGYVLRSIGGLVGFININGSIISSSVTIREISGNQQIGGLIGTSSDGMNIISSYAIIDKINIPNQGLAEGLESDFGGLLGLQEGSTLTVGRIVSSYVLWGSNNIIGKHDISNLGGFVGDFRQKVISSYAVVDSITANRGNAGLLLGIGLGAELNASYGLANTIDNWRGQGGILGYLFDSEAPKAVENSYWNATNNVPITASTSATVLAANTMSARSRDALASPTDFTGIYEEWDNRYCNPTTGEYMESDTHPGGDFQLAWDLGTTDEYPALTCFSNFTPAQQRAASAKVLSGESLPVNAFNQQ